MAAKIACPQTPVICLAGDGCFLMNGQELATAMQYDAPVIFIVVNNGMYGTIRMHQERAYPEHVSGTELRNPDFAALARAYGAEGHTVRSLEGFQARWRRRWRRRWPPSSKCRPIRRSSARAQPCNRCVRRRAAEPVPSTPTPP